MGEPGETETGGAETPPDSRDSRLLPGARVDDRYEIAALLGAGGNAAVYLEFDRELRREVALKSARPASGASPESPSRSNP